MAVFNLDQNATFWENGVGRLYIATDYDNSVFASGNWTNETALIAELEEFTFADVWYFENFATTLGQWEERIITTDYCGVWEITRKQDKIPWFTVDVQEILEMENLALILGEELGEDTWVETIFMKRTQKSKPYQLFKFVTCPKEWKVNVFYFVKWFLANDISIPFNNLAREDFIWTTLEFNVAESGNFAIQKGVPVIESV